MVPNRADIIETVARQYPNVTYSGIIRTVDEFLAEREALSRVPLAPGADKSRWFELWRSIGLMR